MPPSVDQVLRKARRHARNGETDLAAQKYQSVLDKYPQNKTAIEGLKALQLQNTAPYEEQINALVALYTQGQLQETLTQGEKLATQFPDMPFTRNLLGTVNVRLGHFEQAAAHFTKALQIKPDYAEVHNNLGNVLQTLGKTEEAAASYAKALQIEPDYAEAHRNLTAVKKYQDGDAQIHQMEQLIKRPNLPDKDRLHTSFALGKVYDDIGKYDQAYSCLAEGNRLRKAELQYDISSARAVFDKVVSMFSRPVPPLTVAEQPEDENGPHPIFILGMPRSGSTLAEQILASHSKVYGAGELGLLSQSVNSIKWDSTKPSSDQLHSIRQSYLSGLTTIETSAAFITDKMPENFWWIGFIFAAIPEARVVHVKRDARATCWSNFRQFFSNDGNGFAYDLQDTVEYYKMYIDLMTFWHNRFENRIYDLNYKALTENQEDETRNLLRFCSLDWEDQCLEFHTTRRAVQTASETQVRQKMYQGSSEKWRQYEKHLTQMIEALRDF